MRYDDDKPHLPYQSAPMQTALGMYLPKEADEESLHVTVPRIPVRKKDRLKKRNRIFPIFKARHILARADRRADHGIEESRDGYDANGTDQPGNH